jgi:hypothetical protein
MEQEPTPGTTRGIHPPQQAGTDNSPTGYETSRLPPTGRTDLRSARPAPRRIRRGAAGGGSSGEWGVRRGNENRRPLALPSAALRFPQGFNFVFLIGLGCVSLRG